MKKVFSFAAIVFNNFKNNLMKKLLLVVAALLAANNAFSQAKFGVKAGVNFSSLSDLKSFGNDKSYVVELENAGMVAGYHVGVFANLCVGDIVSFQPELLFSMQGGKMQQYSPMRGGEGGWWPTANIAYQYWIYSNSVIA